MKKTALLILSIFIFPTVSLAQDTIKVSVEEFIKQGIENSGQIDFEKQNVELANNQISQVQANRYLPEFNLSTQHGITPGVISQRDDLDPGEYYLDPNLENDWNDWAIFTRAEINAIQPIFSWGALKNAVKAARAGAEAAKHEFEGQKSNLRTQLYELYQSRLLTGEVLRLINEAEGQIQQIEKQIEDEKYTDEFDDSDIYEFEIFKSQFDIQATEVRQNAMTVQRIWNHVLQVDDNITIEPETRFLDPVNVSLKEINFYREHALSYRDEVLAIESGINAAKYGIEANKKKNYPALFLGLTGSFANTPNRPRQTNPFIINNSNYMSAAFGIGVRQNLDFLSIQADVEKARIQYNQARYLKNAAVDGIVLEVNEAYKDAVLSNTKVKKLDEALVTSKKWLRQEQLDYDFDMGDTKDLIDAMKKKFELQVTLMQEVFEHNKNMARLYHKSGLSIMDLIQKEQQ